MLGGSLAAVVAGGWIVECTGYANLHIDYGVDALAHHSVLVADGFFPLQLLPSLCLFRGGVAGGLPASTALPGITSFQSESRSLQRKRNETWFANGGAVGCSDGSTLD